MQLYPEAIQSETKTSVLNKIQYGECCNTLEFKSDGPISYGWIKHLLGKYTYLEDGAMGTSVYFQPGTGGEYPNDDPDVWLYYHPGTGYWIIGPEKGNESGYAFNEGDLDCPED